MQRVLPVSYTHLLAACNPWEYFVTLTLSADKRDRGDLSAFRSALSQYIRDLRKRRGYDIKYLLIPCLLYTSFTPYTMCTPQFVLQKKLALYSYENERKTKESREILI